MVTLLLVCAAVVFAVVGFQVSCLFAYEQSKRGSIAPVPTVCQEDTSSVAA